MSPPESATGMLLYLELHDSYLSELEFEGGSAVVTLNPAYIHRWHFERGTWTGTGWRERLEITIVGLGAEQTTVTVPIPCQLSGGALSVQGRALENLIPLDKTILGPFQLLLQCGGAEPSRIAGKGIEFTMAGNAQFVEALPQEFAPDVRAT